MTTHRWVKNDKGEYIAEAFPHKAGQPREPSRKEPWQMTQDEYKAGTWLHGTTSEFEGFTDPVGRAVGHGVIYFSDPVKAHGKLTQAEHIAGGPFGGKLIRVRVDRGRLKTFDPLNDPKAMEIARRVKPSYHPLTKPGEAGHISETFLEYFDAPDIVSEAVKEGYNHFNFYEVSAGTFSEAITDPTLVSVVGEHRDAIVRALSEGKLVPSEVLAEYPDLQETKP